MLGMKNHFDISGSIEIREVGIAGVACIFMTKSPLKNGDWTRGRLHAKPRPAQSDQSLCCPYEES